MGDRTVAWGVKYGNGAIHGRRTKAHAENSPVVKSGWAEVVALCELKTDEVIVNRADLQESLAEYNAPEANNRLRKALE